MALEARVTHADACFSRFPHRLIMKGLLNSYSASFHPINGDLYMNGKLVVPMEHEVHVVGFGLVGLFESNGGQSYWVAYYSLWISH